MTAEPGASSLEVRDLVVRYDQVVAVDGASLDVPRACVTVLVGPSGCGKTSLLRAVAGFETPAAGSIRIGETLVAGAGRPIAPERRSVGMVFQQGALFPHLTVRDNVLYGVRRRADGTDRAAAALELVGLTGLERRYPDELSGGQQQRVALARALAPAPAMILLDEPFANLDQTLRQRVREEVCSILRSTGVTALLVTHDREEALSIADCVAVMQQGRILQTGSPEDVYHRPGSAAVAELTGEAQLLACTMAGGVLHSPLGRAVCDARDGSALLLVRPEDIVVDVDAEREGTTGEIVARRFFGHDLLLDVRIGDGPTLRVRDLSTNDAGVGTQVRLRLRSRSYSVFAADGQRAQLADAHPLVHG